MRSPGRWTIVEYGSANNTLSEIAAASGRAENDLKLLFEATGRRIALKLGMSSSPLFFERDQLRAIDVAGLIRAAPGIEIEIVPKFLGDDRDDTDWREDFFFLATLSKHGSLLSSEKLRSGTSRSRDLPTLIAWSMIEMERANRRRPLRTYRRAFEHDFAIDGDVDPETVVVPSPDGFEQEHIRYDRANVYNATIKAAATLIRYEVRDASARTQLGRLVANLGPQSVSRNVSHQKLPTRSKSWQDLYDLSVDVLQGFGISYGSRVLAKSPGYVVNTWQVWEDVLTIALRLGFAGGIIQAQSPIVLGKRVRYDSEQQESSTDLNVIPDIRVKQSGRSDEPLILDAKYRTRASRTRQRIDEADIYESLAFARAGNISNVGLLYPAVPTSENRLLGRVTRFEKVVVEHVTIHGLQVEIRGIARLGGLRRFAAQLASEITTAICG